MGLFFSSIYSIHLCNYAIYIDFILYFVYNIYRGAKIYETCKELGVKTVLVEQDNAVNFPDPFAEMEKSFKHLRPIIK